MKVEYILFGNSECVRKNMMKIVQGDTCIAYLIETPSVPFRKSNLPPDRQSPTNIIKHFKQNVSIMVGHNTWEYLNTRW